MSTDERKYTLAVYAGLREMITENGIECALKLAKSYGYDSSEMLYIKHECDGILAKSDEWRAATRASGVTLSCISCFVDVVSTDMPYKKDEKSIDAVKKCIDLAKEVGCPLVHHTLVTRLSGGNSAYPCVFLGYGIRVLIDPKGVADVQADACVLAPCVYLVKEF